MRRFLLTTFGCQMNLADGQRLRGILASLGYDETESEEEADLILFNTCCVREHAEDRLFSRVQGLKRLKHRKPDLIIAIGGCLAQHHRDRLLEQLPVVDLVFGPNDIEQLPALLQDLQPGKPRVGAFVEVGHFAGDQADGIVLERPFSAFVNIIRGCTNFCTYCIVPSVRGPEVSRPIGEIVELVKGLARGGVTEITLLGQNVNAYGKDLGRNHGFVELLEALEPIDGIRWIRFLTSHPRDFHPAVISRIGRLGKVCEAFHLPVQAGSNRILELMNRGYTREDYLKLVATVRCEIPGVSLTTDIICGFPSETEAEFEETLDLVRQVAYDSAFMYYYSPREGTRAVDLPDQLPEQVRKERLARLIELQNKIGTEISATLVGKTVEVLAEAPSTHSPGHLYGKTRTGRVVDFAGATSLIGRFVQVRIDRTRLWTVSGTLIDPPVAERGG